VFEGERGEHRNALMLGAALALEVSGYAGSPAEGLERAAEAIDRGRASALLTSVAGFHARRAHA
jgi:anthranilate phosphoribosyltransferase